jgi:hypothetical protein
MIYYIYSTTYPPHVTNMLPFVSTFLYLCLCQIYKIKQRCTFLLFSFMSYLVLLYVIGILLV